MNKKISWLAALFALQLLLVLTLSLSNHNQSQAFQVSNLLQVSGKTIDKLVINDGDNTLTIEKDNQYWRLPDKFGLKAAQIKVDTLINKLETLSTNWPVATTSSSHHRFDVADDKFQRKLDVYNGGTLINTLYIGTSPGFKKSHLRTQNNDKVYALALNNYDLPVLAKDWLDKSLLKIDKPLAVKADDFELVNSSNNWKLIDSKTNEKLDTVKVNSLINILKNIQITDIANKTISFNDNAIQLQVNTYSGDIDLKLINLDDNYYIKHSNFEPTFVINKSTYESLKKPNRKELLTEI